MQANPKAKKPLLWKRKEKKPKEGAENKAEERRLRTFARYGIVPGELENPSTTQKLLTVFIKRFWSLFLACILVFVCLCGYFYVDSYKTVQSVMTLNYEQSAKGQNPNGTRFNISDLSSETVLKRAIEYAGLTGQVTPAELANNLTVSGSAARDINKTYYITTSYNISFKNPKSVRGISSWDMLGLICKAYKDFFYDSYTTNTAILSDDYSRTGQMEYREVGAFFSLRASQINRYLNMRQSENVAFTSEETGETFQSLGKLVSNLQNYQIADYNAYVWENGIVRDAENYHATLSYINSQMSKQHTIESNEYSIRREVIDLFSNAMSTSILIPTINTKQEFYMARTKSGVDYLASQADYHLSNAQSLDQSITKNNDRLNKINPTAAAQATTADTMIKNVLTELERIESLIVKTDKEYISQRTRNYLTFDERGISIVNRVQLRKSLALCFLFFVLAFFAFYIEYKKALRDAAGRA